VDIDKFDEQKYLKVNPDVDLAVRQGLFKSGWHHYEKHGRKEGRSLTSIQDLRREKVLSHIDKAGLGLEIGPSHNPIAPKADGFNVQILDHLDQTGLKEKYLLHNVNTEKIEEVDYVWSGEPLEELIGKNGGFDWIIASHVIEHIPDLIRFFQQCEKILKPDGKLSLVIPDKRYCFDCFQAPTMTGEFLDAYIQKRIRPSPGKIFDHFSNAASCSNMIAWNNATVGKYDLLHTLDQSKELFERSINSNEYIDVHLWRFVPESFRLVIEDLNALKLMNLIISHEYETEGCEFYCTLTRNKALGENQHKTGRKEMLSIISRLRK